MRIAVSQIIQESNSFVPFKTTLANFEAQYIRRGQEVLDRLGGARIEIAGMTAVLREAGIEPVPWLATHGSSGGPLTRETFETLIGYLLAHWAGADFTIGIPQGNFAPLARVLPLDYASAGAAGALLGYWVGAERPPIARRSIERESTPSSGSAST